MGTSGFSSVPTAIVMSMPSSVSSMRTSWIQASSLILGPCIMPSTVRTVSASSTMEPGIPLRSESTCTFAGGGPSAGTTSSTTPERARCRRVQHVGARLRQGAGEGLDRPLGQAGRDVARLGVAVQDGVDDIVDRAGTDGVVRGVAHHLAPGQLEEPVRVGRGRLEEGAQGFGAPLELPLGDRPPALDVDPVGRDAHQHVGADARAQFALHRRQAIAGRAGQVVRERRHLEDVLVLQVVGLGDHPSEPWLGHQVVGPVHAEQVSGQELLDLLDVVAGPPDERLGVVGERGTVPVADGQVLGAHRRAVRRIPHERVLGHLRRHAAPHHGVAEAGQTEDLGHLRDVAEHVGQVADVHHASEGRAAGQAHLEIAHDGLAGGEELVHEDVPGAHAHPARGRQRTETPLGFGPYLEVVVDHGHLAVEHEVRIAGVALEERDQGVDQFHQGQAKVLVGLVPFAVPVRVRNDVNPTSGHDRQTMTCRRPR